MRAEIIAFFQHAKTEAAMHGKTVVFKNEFVSGWERFAADPSAQTAAAWLAAATEYVPFLQRYFTACSPGGEFYADRERRNAISDFPAGKDVGEQAAHFRCAVDSVVRDVHGSQRAAEALKLVIFTAAHQCMKLTEQFLQTLDKVDRTNRVFLIDCEFFYFFMHLANRQFHTVYPKSIGERWQSQIGPTYIAEFVESRIGHWPQHLKDGVRTEMYEKMNDAEMDYAKCRGFLPGEKGINAGDALFVKLTENVAELAGASELNNKISIMEGILQTFARSDFSRCVDDVASTLRR